MQAKLRGSSGLDVNTAFTSIAIIGMVTLPANMFMVLLVNLASIISSADRVQKYLLTPDRVDQRIFTKSSQHAVNGSYQANGDTEALAQQLSVDDDSEEDSILTIDEATVRPAPTADPVLKSINLAVKPGSLVVCSGAVGTGKTTLAKAILGDLPPDSGVISASIGRIAYCAQSPWLINGTVKRLICGPDSQGQVDEEWYRKVVQACDLEEDLEQLPNGDETIIGSRGITLSGGQRQRVVSIAEIQHKSTTY